jgi:hypothetical protein
MTISADGQRSRHFARSGVNMMVSPSRRSCAISTRRGSSGAVRRRATAPATIWPAASGSTSHREGPRLFMLASASKARELGERFVQDNELQNLFGKAFLPARPGADESIDAMTGQLP